MKRHGGEDSYGYGSGYGNSTGKRYRSDSYQDALAAGKYELRILVPSRLAGAVIGKGGESIKRLRNDFDATLTVPDSQTPERILTVVATIENVISCISDIIPRLDDIDRRDDDDDGMHSTEVRMLVHQSHAGAVIGKGGFRIKELREETNTQLKVFTQCAPQSSDRVIQITGKPDRIAECINLIINMLKDIPVKGSSRPYEPMFYDPSYVNDYGGYPPDRNYRGPPRGMSMGGGGGGGIYGYGGGMGAMQRSPRGYGAPFGGRSAIPGYPPFATGPVQTTQVTIPNELGGTIIGKGGERINRIREESGAHITVEPQQDGKERIISISGTQAQIQTAQYLLQQCVRSSIAGRKYLSEH